VKITTSPVATSAPPAMKPTSEAVAACLAALARVSPVASQLVGLFWQSS
jgi:hypothetical protein